MAKMDELLLTPVALMDLLSQIDELKMYEIGVSETPDHTIQLQIGESVYELDEGEATDIPVDDSVVEDIAEVNEEAYTRLAEISGIEVLDSEDDQVPVESGIIKEIAKTLLVGGLVRMAANTLKK